MAVKNISLRTNKSILIDQKAFLESVNGLRLLRGSTKKAQAPTTIKKLLSNTKVLESETEEFGSIYLSISYNNVEGIPCSRSFPNFGLDVVSKSTMAVSGDHIAVDIDLTVSAGKKKWQLKEIEECSEIFKDGNFEVTLNYNCDQTTEPAGHSVVVQVLNGNATKFGNTSLPSSFFDEQ